MEKTHVRCQRRGPGCFPTKDTVAPGAEPRPLVEGDLADLTGPVSPDVHCGCHSSGVKRFGGRWAQGHTLISLIKNLLPDTNWAGHPPGLNYRPFFPLRPWLWETLGHRTGPVVSRPRETVSLSGAVDPCEPRTCVNSCHLCHLWSRNY